MVRAAGQVHRQAVRDRVLTGFHGAAHHTEGALHERRAPRQPDAPLVGGVQGAVFHAVHVLARVHPPEVLVATRGGSCSRSGVTSPCASAPSRSRAYFAIGKRWPSGNVIA